MPPAPAPSILIVAALAFAKATLQKLRHGDSQHQHQQQDDKNQSQQQPSLPKSQSAPAANTAAGPRHLVRQMTQEEMQPLSEHLTRIGSQCLAEGLDSSELLSSWHSSHRWLSLLTWTPLSPTPSDTPSHSPAPLTAFASIKLALKLGVELLAIVFVALNESAATYRLLLLLLLGLLLLMDATQCLDLCISRSAAPDSSSDAAQLPKPEPEPKQLPQAVSTANPLLSGTWYKVDDLSDSQEEAARLLKLGGLARTAMRMFKGMEFKLDDAQLAMTAITKVPFLKLSKETYALDGAVSTYPRRDMRRGNFVGYIRVQEGGSINLYYRFEEPLAGHCCDEMKLLSDNELHIITHLTVGAESCAYRVVYYRAGSRPRRSNSPTEQQADGFSVEVLPAGDDSNSNSNSSGAGAGDGLSRQANLYGLLTSESDESEDSKHCSSRDGEERRMVLDRKQLPPTGQAPRHKRHTRHAQRGALVRSSLDESGSGSGSGRREVPSADRARVSRSSLDERRSHLSPDERKSHSMPEERKSHLSPAQQGRDERRCSSPFARVCGAEA